MKHVFFDTITLIEGTDPFDNQYLFDIATDIFSPIEHDMAQLLVPYHNDRVEYHKDYKLWNQVYPGEKELQIFQEIVESALAHKQKIHISNITLRDELEIIRQIYEELGYFDVKENRFQVDFKNTPITIGVNIRNLAYSTKDYKSERENICFVPPPREPGHVKALFAGLNAGIVSTIHISDTDKEKALIQGLITSEKTNLTTLSGAMYENFLAIGFEINKQELILS
ncbi:MAG: hypothetical protein Q8K26_00635 [Candidatus Gracilibacteria bacterium]|nr:hypothetical protein [Candidatus Gracilibacteria bacterium]